MNARWLSLLGILALCAAPQGAAARDINLTIGKQETLDSNILSEKCDILIAESSHFQPGAPVLVLLDAEMTFRTVKAIIDHLVNTGRLPPVSIAEQLF
jgi:predicted alpha/beta superfamily hydrolase